MSNKKMIKRIRDLIEKKKLTFNQNKNTFGDIFFFPFTFTVTFMSLFTFRTTFFDFFLFSFV